jgi:hypothetical protein
MLLLPAFQNIVLQNFMKKNSIIATLFALSVFSISLDILDDNGKAGKTGSPGETTCNTTNCHTGNAVNATGGSVTIDCPTLTNWQYTPGHTYQINVTVERSGINLFGLGFEALKSDGANAGTFTITNTTQMTTKNATVLGKTRTSVVHKLNGGASSNSHTFTFNWNAPATDVGAITFYVAGNCTNANNAVSGDFIYTASQLVNSPTTSVLDLSSNKSNFKVYPNPATDNINVSYQLNESAEVSIKLISLTGELVYNQHLSHQTIGIKNHQIVLNNEIPKGIYFVEVLANSESFTQKVIFN